MSEDGGGGGDIPPSSSPPPPLSEAVEATEAIEATEAAEATEATEAVIVAASPSADVVVADDGKKLLQTTPGGAASSGGGVEGAIQETSSAPVLEAIDSDSVITSTSADQQQPELIRVESDEPVVESPAAAKVEQQQPQPQQQPEQPEQQQSSPVVTDADGVPPVVLLDTSTTVEVPSQQLNSKDAAASPSTSSSPPPAPEKQQKEQQPEPQPLVVVNGTEEAEKKSTEESSTPESEDAKAAAAAAAASAKAVNNGVVGAVNSELNDATDSPKATVESGDQPLQQPPVTVSADEPKSPESTTTTTTTAAAAVPADKSPSKTALETAAAPAITPAKAATTETATTTIVDNEKKASEVESPATVSPPISASTPSNTKVPVETAAAAAAAAPAVATVTNIITPTTMTAMINPSPPSAPQPPPPPPTTITSFYEDINEVLADSSTSDEVKFGLLCTKILAAMSANHSIHVNEINLITDNILKLLITDDMQRIKRPQTLRLFFCDYLKMLPSKVVAEILSVLIAVLKKSLLNLEFSKDLLLVAITQTAHLDHLIKHFIREIINLQTTYSCNVKELLAILRLSEEDPRLLHYLRNANLYQRNRPTAFFAFPGINGSVMALPPFTKWPIQNGWTFVTWFRLESNATNSQPYLYYFRTAKSGVGYSAHFTGNCLVLTSMKIKGKGFQHCIPYEFTPHRWFHCAITYVARWRTAEVKVYVNGQLTANTEMAWQVATGDHFDKCFIGGTPDLHDTYLFSGQIASLYLFHEALSPSQICSIHRLGASYVGEYRHPNESQLELPVGIRRVLYEEKLAAAIFCLYTPVAVESERLCLQGLPKGNTSYFTSSPHAALLGSATAVRTYSIAATLQSVGGIRALLPLLYKFAGRADAEAVGTLIGFICDLLEYSPQWFGNEMLQAAGFVTIAAILGRNARLLLTADTLEVLLGLTKTLISTAGVSGGGGGSGGGPDAPLILKQMLDNVLFNPSLWVYVEAKIQLKLYCYLSNEFLSDGIIFNEVRRISTVLQLLHSLKYYYWLAEEKGYSVRATDYSLRPSYDELETIRSYILLFIKQLIIKGGGIHLDELQAVLNYLTTVHEDANVLDVLQMLQSLMCEHPASLIPAFDGKQGVQTVFKLLNSANEEIRIQALKLLGYFLSRSTAKRKSDVMGPHNLYMLLCEHLMRFTPLSMATYSALFEILTETSIESIRITSPCNSVLKIENAMVLKVIATLLIEEEKSSSAQQIKELFINDLWSLLINNRENRRLVLQMSVWQHWLINLVEAKNDLVTNQILAIFRILLYHAIKYEYGGWRVWIDTLAIIHAKISFDDFNEQFGGKGSASAAAAASTQSYMDAYLLESRKKSMENLRSNLAASGIGGSGGAGGAKVKSVASNHLEGGGDKAATKQAESADDPRPEDERGEQRQAKKKSSKKTSSRKEADGGGGDEVDKEDDEEDVADDEEGEDEDDDEGAAEQQQPAAICTISSIQNESALGAAKDSATDENGSKRVKTTSESSETAATVSAEANSSSSPTATDAAPSRKGRYDDQQQQSATTTTKATETSKSTAASAKPSSKPSISVSATPAFRIPEFRWSALHLKLLNDLLYSIEADLQVWRSQSCGDFKLDAAGASTASGGAAGSSSSVGSNKSNASNASSSAAAASAMEAVLANADNQIYIINAIHLISQLCDNVIISSGGLLPLLASATGGTSASSNSASSASASGAAASSAAACVTIGGEGFSSSQANFLIYRLANLIDLLCFAATHVNFTELEAEKNMSSGGILRQCLRIVCTIAVKNCLLLQRSAQPGSSSSSAPYEFELISENEYLYKGVSIVSSAELFAVDFNPELSDLIAYKTVALDMDSLHYGLITPIKDSASLLQEMDINRLRACIYRDADSDTRQSQFLALATLYFISVLMVSKYRDIIEPKQAVPPPPPPMNGGEAQLKVNSTAEEGNAMDSVELSSSTKNNSSSSSSSNISEKLTSKLEATLSSICPLLKEIIVDFAAFLSKTLLGSHGQELITREAIRTFKRADASPVELVMLLCSQEWQNTLQKNAGLAFIELINEGRLLSHAMKDHIVRVAMEAEFILNRLRADDVTKHDAFTQTIIETNAARLQEESIINSLILSAKRRDWMIFSRFKESLRQQMNESERRRYFKLDSWEDDSRRRRRFVYDSLGESLSGRLKALAGGAGLSEVAASNSCTESNAESNADHLSSPIVPPNRGNSGGGGGGGGVSASNSNGNSHNNPNGSLLLEDDDSADSSFGIWDGEDSHQRSTNAAADSATASGFRGLSGIGPKGGSLKEFKDWDLVALQYCDLLTYNGKISFADIRAIFTRRYLLQQNALEIFLSQRTSVMFAFADFDTVKKVVRYLPPVGVGVKYGISQSRRASLMTPRQLFSSSNMTARWQKREVSNFEYLMFLNTIAGRTYQDLNQYPVFPWILTNYEGAELDLAQPTNFRDLSKPIGALNSERREEFIERYSSWDNALVPAFHYGTHYSTAAFTLSWLIRIQPFLSIYLSLQDGGIEDESRLFKSIRDAWVASLMGGQQNVKELIPEFFYLPEIFYRCNGGGGGGGGDGGGSLLPDIELPAWAESPEHFVRIHRTALESDLVSCQLHQWIDLIFGYKQRGPEAVRAVNVFYYLTYEGNIDLAAIGEPSLREAIETQIRHFGQTPSQLTADPHPPRSSALHVSPLMFSGALDELSMALKFPFNAPVVHISACTGGGGGGGGYSLTDLADLIKNLTCPFYGPIRRKTHSGVSLRKQNLDSSSTSRDIRI
ncbi:PREDICTED: lipopolysaccharide-responsive and beige-like anchor protein [Rhagoletis zephyria]|uniref:lipopolysaccharide-responsive and beige-like anchor protein n=1 Tax=Rhagoletis zephyria TaxID=28612 RepID=UPI00081195EB|nr:PREDICTED: lipopolysaccharide-responsive and beige-like anchor protein [Rhagoletis zephyria]